MAHNEELNSEEKLRALMRYKLDTLSKEEIVSNIASNADLDLLSVLAVQILMKSLGIDMVKAKEILKIYLD